jgi:hypothetical protein
VSLRPTRRRASGARRRHLGGQTQMAKEPPDRSRVLDEGDQPEPGRHSAGTPTHRNQRSVASAAPSASSILPAWVASMPCLVRRRKGQPARVIAMADKAQQRLCRRFRKLTAEHKPARKIAVAMARELAGFVWAVLQPAPAPAPAPAPQGGTRRHSGERARP